MKTNAPDLSKYGYRLVRTEHEDGCVIYRYSDQVDETTDKDKHSGSTTTQ